MATEDARGERRSLKTIGAALLRRIRDFDFVADLPPAEKQEFDRQLTYVNVGRLRIFSWLFGGAEIIFVPIMFLLSDAYRNVRAELGITDAAHEAAIAIQIWWIVQCALFLLFVRRPASER